MAAGKVIDVKSPCVGHCKQDLDKGLCGGCWRTNLEKVNWSTMPAEDKLDTLILCQIRKDRIPVLNGTFGYHPGGC